MPEQAQAAIPAAWVTAGFNGVIAFHKQKRDAYWNCPSSEEVAAIIARVRPLIEAAEGERIAKLADRVQAISTSDEGTSCFFSALIREGAS